MQSSESGSSFTFPSSTRRVRASSAPTTNGGTATGTQTGSPPRASRWARESSPSSTRSMPWPTRGRTANPSAGRGGRGAPAGRRAEQKAGTGSAELGHRQVLDVAVGVEETGADVPDGSARRGLHDLLVLRQRRQLLVEQRDLLLQSGELPRRRSRRLPAARRRGHVHRACDHRTPHQHPKPFHRSSLSPPPVAWEYEGLNNALATVSMATLG